MAHPTGVFSDVSSDDPSPIRFPVALEELLAVRESVCFYDTGLSQRYIPFG